MKKRIKDLLRSNKKYCKSDNTLMARVWYDDLAEKINSMNALEFLLELSKGKLTNWDSVTRARRKLQSEDPTLRDEKVFELRAKKELDYRMKFSSRDTL